ncbi:hypothetical protein IEQ34_019190 [Dendrobium chrysotoxum]|uniref:Uncharacterized protein n=1 Tax=Dendrobium chrysotoxum TaxID=161865 RepID=A0AAV7G661_DENCH|nr:hypothetical protein IEQ34_019190 [Dendrobium chrysotoxum]
MPASESVANRLLNAVNGPMLYTLPNLSRTAARTSGSRESKVLRMIPMPQLASSGFLSVICNIGSAGLVVRIKIGRSRSRIPSIPGITSIFVSRYPLVKKLSSLSGEYPLRTSSSKFT